MRHRVNQAKLYETYIKPHESDLLARILGYRRLVDQAHESKMRDDFFENPEREVSEKGSMDIQRYPFGHCYQIRDTVLGLLTEDMPSYLSDFKANGGAIKEKWMVYDGRERGFSNVIQIGDRIIDPAFEEFSGTHINVGIILSQDESPYKELTLEGIVKSAEEYWQEECFSTSHILGPLSFLFPIVAFRKDGRIHFLSSSTSTIVESSKGTEGERWNKENESGKGTIPEPHYSNLREMLSDIRILSVTNPEFLARIFSKYDMKLLSNQDFLKFLYFVEKMLIEKKSVAKTHDSKAYKEYKSQLTKDIGTEMRIQYFMYIKRLEDLYNTFIWIKSKTKANFSSISP